MRAAEGMILLSNLIKSFHYVALDDSKLIEAMRKTAASRPVSIVPDDESSAEEMDRLHAMKERIIRDAESFAEEHIRQSIEEASLLKEKAQQEIDAWWQERRAQDERIIEEMKNEGFEQGYREGASRAEEAIKEQYAQTIREARAILEQAHRMKRQIIQEAEPFLIELSCSIAEKIIGKQLSISQDWIIEMIKKLLARRREQGVITLCVSPAHFSYIVDAKDELALALNSQAELSIVPDVTVQDDGCVIRTNFGSVDARINTQLTEIKQALRQVAIRSEDASEDE